MIADLLSGRLSRLCQMPDGRLTSEAELPAVVVCGSFNPLHEGHRRLAEVAAKKLGRPTAFELAVVNVDKPPLAEAEVRRRLRQFEWYAHVWLTQEPNYVGKASLFPAATFVVGADTATRVVQPRYYRNTETMASAFNTIRAAGCRFLVAGRSDRDGRFVTAEALALANDLFIGLGEKEFRVDVSSTQLRTRCET